MIWTTANRPIEEAQDGPPDPLETHRPGRGPFRPKCHGAGDRVSSRRVRRGSVRAGVGRRRSVRRVGSSARTVDAAPAPLVAGPGPSLGHRRRAGPRRARRYEVGHEIVEILDRPSSGAARRDAAAARATSRAGDGSSTVGGSRSWKTLRATPCGRDVRVSMTAAPRARPGELEREHSAARASWRAATSCGGGSARPGTRRGGRRPVLEPRPEGRPVAE